MRRKTIGWFGLFFYGIAAFSAVGEKQFGFFTTERYFAPLEIAGRLVIDPQNFFATYTQISETFPYVLIILAAAYFAGFVFALYGLIYSRIRYTLYGGLFGILFAFVGYISLLGVSTHTKAGFMELWSIGTGIHLGFLGAILMVYSAQRR
ncbi:hypothetical protein [Geoglobus ahangari]